MLSSIKVSIEDYKRGEKGKNIGNGEATGQTPAVCTLSYIHILTPYITDRRVRPLRPLLVVTYSHYRAAARLVSLTSLPKWDPYKE